ncbi:hypothetical protein BFJ63_vAg18345 [Fusarium oxysporum f. sp. narcissi]|uniref:Uncharacterized protein n=1 Tax=Fusarium oxysporum f. sp. narcissi TaxID=451672 RepID=A0A4Q2UXL9_FUSOX|nr:hypothetical protein BFJ63_vAg18345 [Fusarium oxysporum f. sp. narcissi]
MTAAAETLGSTTGLTTLIPMQDFDQLSNEFLIQLAIFSCETVTRTAAQSEFSVWVIPVARREKRVLYAKVSFT